MTRAQQKFHDDERASRNAMLAKVHIYKKRLGMDEAAYRAFLHGRTGRDSAGDLSITRLAGVLDEMKRLFAPMPGASCPRGAHLALMRGLWADCARFGLVHSNSDRALARFAKCITGIDRPEWLDSTGANAVIEALKVMIKRAAK
jgi:phage gp16-like protein